MSTQPGRQLCPAKPVFEPANFELSGESVSQDINVVALVKGEERYIFLFNDSQKSETLRTLGRYASDPRLSFSWYDAAVLSQKVRNTTKSAPTNEGVGLPLPSNRFGSHSVQDIFLNEE
jgi:hypothetical protein